MVKKMLVLTALLIPSFGFAMDKGPSNDTSGSVVSAGGACNATTPDQSDLSLASSSSAGNNSVTAPTNNSVNTAVVSSNSAFSSLCSFVSAHPYGTAATLVSLVAAVVVVADDLFGKKCVRNFVRKVRGGTLRKEQKGK